MNVKLSESIQKIELALLDVSNKSDIRRLRMYGDDIKCRPKCSGCCSRLIEISMSEAVLLYEYLKNSGVWYSVKEKALNQIPLLQKTKPLSWFKMNIKCPVLGEDELCSGYKMRPAVCSTHFVRSDPSLCSPWSEKSSGHYNSVDFSDIYIKFKKLAFDVVDGFGILNMELPIQIALLLAEKINTMSGLTEEQVWSLIKNEL